MADVRGEDPTVAGTSSGDPLATPTGDAVIEGRIAGRWDILALLGTGGMGNVYRALDRELNEVVALKVLRRGEEGASLDRFRHEVRLARRVTHVNVARTHDIGNHADTVFLTMELIDGEPLSRRIARGPVPWRDAIAIARGICAGVGAAHAAGVVHRDLKPDNVMLARDGRVVVTDFGIAATHELARGEDTVEVTGTPAWMAPEQLAGTADARSDVYAIGEIVWTMLTGVHPWYQDGKVQVVARAGAAAPPRLERSAVPEAVAEVIERCLAHDPAKRFRDGAALGESLYEAATVTPTPTRPQTAPTVTGDVKVGVDAIKNLGDPADDFVAAGLAEDLIDVLGRVRGLRVRSLEGAPARDDLDVVVSGSLRRAGDQVRIAVRAVGARDGFQIWSQRFDRSLDQILKVTDEVARDVATALSATAARGTVGRDIATDQFVVELYLRARHLAEKSWVDDPRPLALLQAALERDPDSPIVLAAYAQLLARRLNQADVDGDKVRRDAESAARQAIERGGDLAEPWVALAVVFHNRAMNAHAIRAARLALERAPGHAEAADTAGRILSECNPVLEEAATLLERAHWTNPRMPSNLVDLVRVHGLRADWSRVHQLLADPGTESSAALMIARARVALWRRGGAPEIPTELPGLQRFSWAVDMMTEVLGKDTLSEANMQAWRARVHGLPRGSRVRKYFAQLGAECALRAHQLDYAWEMIDEAVVEGLIDTAWLERMPLMGPIRDDPRFVVVRATLESRIAPIIAAWKGPLPTTDVDAW